MKYLESLSATDSPKTVDASIIDVMFFLRLHPNLPSTFGGVARYLGARVSEFEGHVLHFVCDKWVHPSIKDCERKDRDKSKLTYYAKTLHKKDQLARCFKKQHFQGIAN